MTASDDELRREVQRLRAENEALKTSSASRPVRLQVSERGGVSVYGIRRFPITFYYEEWRRILSLAGEIEAFLASHEGELKKKPDAGAAQSGSGRATTTKSREASPKAAPEKSP